MKTIVVVDDELDIAEALAAILEDEGFRVAMAHNGRDGLSRIREMHPDLALVDAMMPLMDGTEMVEQLRAQAAFETLPVVLMSAARTLHEAEGPWTAFLAKPFSASRLLETVHALLGEATA